MTITWYGNTCIGLSIKPRGGGERSALFFPHDRTSRARTLQDRAALFLEDREDNSKKEDLPSPAPSQFLIAYPGEYERAGFVVRGIPISQGSLTSRGEDAWNALYIVAEEGMRIAHLGFVKKPALSDQELEQVGAVDILLLPVGGGRVLGPKEAARMLEQLEPKVVIPLAFKAERKGARASSDGHRRSPRLVSKEFLSLEPFLKEVASRKQESLAKYSVKAKDLPQEGVQVVVLEAQ